MNTKLDTTAIVHCALMNERVINNYRISVTVDHVVDKDILQRAVDKLVERFPMICCRIISDGRWYYSEKMDSTVTVVESALKTGESISNFGMMAVTAGFFLVLSALLMIACFRWFMKLVNMMIENQKQMIENQQKSMQEMMASQQESMQLLLEETKQQNQKLNDIS